MKNTTGKKLSSRLVSCLLAVVMLLSLAIPASAAFSDVSNNSWYADEVEYCRENGLMSGTSATEFSPNAPMTRDMLITVLYRLSGSPAVSGASKFEDAVSGRYYYNAVLWAEQNGIAAGMSKTRFGVGVPVNREQMAVFFWRYAGEQAPETSASFADQNRISTWAVDAVNWAREKNVISGKGNNRFDPQGMALRCEVATVLKNYAENVAENDPGDEQEPSPNPDPGTNPALAPDPDPEPEPEPAPSQKKVLVAYFSCTNNTENVAKKIETALGGQADLQEIVPAEPYTTADLNYMDSSSRSQFEQNDPSARPEISGSISKMSQYDVVFVGYPIWNGQAPKIIYTFLKSYNFSGKTIIPFCTSASSGMDSSATNLHDLTSGATWQNGQRFSGSASQANVTTWVNGLNLDLTASAN